MNQYELKDGTKVQLEEGQDVYGTCRMCPVLDRCKRVSKEVPLPNDYLFNTECNGYVMVNRAVLLSDIPREYQGKNRNSFDFTGKSEVVATNLMYTFNNTDRLVAQGSNIALMSPNKGTGKTLAGSIILNEYMYGNCMRNFDYENPMVLYIKYGQWANELRSQYQLKDDDLSLRIAQRVEMMKKVPLLMLDDIGSGRITDFIRDLTYDVIDYRKESGLSTVFTTNMTEQQLNHPDCLGDMITSRLFFNTAVFVLNGEDRRFQTTKVFE